MYLYRVQKPWMFDAAYDDNVGKVTRICLGLEGRQAVHVLLRRLSLINLLPKCIIWCDQRLVFIATGWLISLTLYADMDFKCFFAVQPGLIHLSFLTQ